MDSFCRGNCSEQLAQALHACGDSQYVEVVKCKYGIFLATVQCTITCIYYYLRDPQHAQGIH